MRLSSAAISVLISSNGLLAYATHASPPCTDMHRPARGAVPEPLLKVGPVDNRFRAGVVAVSTTATSSPASTGVGDVLDVAAALRPKRDAEVCLAATTAAATGTVTTTGA